MPRKLPNGTNAFYYLLSDQEGSVSQITNSGGAVVVGESFTAYGNRRNSTTWSGTPSGSDLTAITGVTRHGYTFQEALGQMGLNDMVGRVQDAITGRFLSADPTMPDIAAGPQAYNRYSYADNNPLTYIDPTGFYDTVPNLGQVTITGSYEGGGGGGEALNGTSTGSADLNDIRFEERVAARLARLAAKGRSNPGTPSKPTNQADGSPQQTSPPQASQPPTVPDLAQVVIEPKASMGISIQSGLIAQEIFFGEDDIYEDPGIRQLKSGNLTEDQVWKLLKEPPNYTPETQAPPPLPAGPPPAPWWFSLMKLIGNAIDRWNGFTPSAAPMCTAKNCA